MPDIAEVPDDELLAMANQVSPLAALTSYGANLETLIPFMHQLGSAIVASSDLSNFSQKYSDLESSQKATRAAGINSQPRIEMPSYFPDITPTRIGMLGGMLATAPVGASKTVPQMVPIAARPRLQGISAMLAGEDYTQ